jgi:hypothetical protein
VTYARRHTGAYATAKPASVGAPYHVPARLAGFAGPRRPAGGAISAVSSAFRTAREILVSPFGCVRPASSVPSSDGPQRRCRRCRSRDFVNLAESTVVGVSNLVLGVWLHGATGQRDDAWARGARGATTWASVRGVRGEVCVTLLGTNPSPLASRPPPPGKRWCHGPAVLDRSYASISSAISCFDALASHVHYGYSVAETGSIRLC